MNKPKSNANTGRKRGPMPQWWIDKIQASRSASLPTPEARFWAKVDKSGGKSACWLWTSPAERKGYGVIWHGGKVCYAHRISWLLAGNTLEDGKVIDHICRVPKCVNPSHLRLVTPAENCHAGISVWAVNKRKTHCKRGHPFTPENTAYTVTYTGKTRHGYPSKAPRRARICLTCEPSRWKHALIPRDPPPDGRRRKRAE